MSGVSSTKISFYHAVSSKLRPVSASLRRKNIEHPRHIICAVEASLNLDMIEAICVHSVSEDCTVF